MKPLRWPAWYSGVDSALAGLVLLFAFVSASFVARNSDVWLHLAAGKRLLKGDYVPGNDPFSYAAAERAWVNHSWLTDAVASLLYGGEGKVLVIAKAIIVALAFGVLLAIRRPRYSLWPWAVVACVAVLAAAPQFTLRPYVVSMLFLAITLYLLFRLPRSDNPWRFPIAIGITFCLWSNSDQWFFLGPLALALVLVGELIQKYLLNTPDETASAEEEPLGRLPDIPTLAIALGIGVLACMVNPHHVRVWELPFELVGAAGIDADPRLKNLLISPLDELYREHPQLGYNGNGLAYVILFLGGAALLGFGYARVRVSHIALWVGFAILSLLSMYAIPFFAIVAVPLIAAQLNAFSTRAELKTWGDPKSRLVWIGSSLGRIVCVLAVCALCVLAYPGWVHPDPGNQAYARRVAWGVEPDPLLVQAAEQLEDWREKEKLPLGTRGVITNIDFANYVAWYAPREKVFVNGRFNHHEPELPDYVRVRKGLGLVTVKDEPPNQKDATDVLKKLNADFVVVSASTGESFRSRTREATVALYGSWSEWTPWYVNGRTAVFGWYPPGETPKTQLARLRVDPVLLAFGPRVTRLEEPELKQPLAELGWEQPFVLPVKPAPPGVAEAFGWLQYRQAPATRMSHRQFIREAMIWPLTEVQPTSGPAMWLRYAMGAAESQGTLRIQPTDTDDARDSAALRAAAILTLRAARRAIKDDPDHPEPYFALGEALGDSNLPLSESERALGRVIAYRQCLVRMPKPNRYQKGQYGIPAAQAALALVDIYLGPNNVVTQLPQPNGRPYEVVTRFMGMPIDVRGIGVVPGMHGLAPGGVGDMVVIARDKTGLPISVRIPADEFNPNDPRFLVVGGPTMLPIDVARETVQLAIDYAKIDLSDETGKMTEESRNELDKLEKLKTAVEDEVIKSKQVYDPFKSSGRKLPELVRFARATSLHGTALQLLEHKDTDLAKEYGAELPHAALYRVRLELALGRIENADELLKMLASPENSAAIEKAGLTPHLHQLKYQKSLHAGEYRAAGEILETMIGKQIGVFDGMPPLGPNTNPSLLLDAIRLRYNTQEPEAIKTALLRPPLLVPMHPLQRTVLLLAEAPHRANPAELKKERSSPLVWEGWVGEWAMLSNVLQQRAGNHLQLEADFFYQRGVLSLLEGDIPAARRRFEQSSRKPPAGWGLPIVGHREAQMYLQLIQLAERRALAP